MYVCEICRAGSSWLRVYTSDSMKDMSHHHQHGRRFLQTLYVTLFMTSMNIAPFDVAQLLQNTHFDVTQLSQDPAFGVTEPRRITRVGVTQLA